MKKSDNNMMAYAFVILLGGLSGTLLGDIIGSKLTALSVLKHSYTIGSVTPFVIDLKFMVFTLGLSFHINIMTIIGIVVAIILYKKL